jgi:hypothetical protein
MFDYLIELVVFENDMVGKMVVVVEEVVLVLILVVFVIDFV